MIWTAEVGSMHKGNMSLAFEFIRAFSEAGADILKFQFGWTKEAQERWGHEYNPVRYIDDWAERLHEWCDYFGVELMASIWSREGLEAARSVGMNAYKIASKMDDQVLIEEILSDSEGRQVYWSGGNVFCISGYPVYPEELKLPATFDKYIGYSDHTHGIEACLLAVARGAQYIEKHVCLDKTDLVTRDTPFSATPEEFERMVKIGNSIERLLDAGA